MSMPFYTSPEQVMQDKAEYARKGIARGKSSVTLEYADGVLLMAENPSSLMKIGEIYDRIAFAGVGRYNEYDQLRIAGIRHADVKGYTYSRDDVDPQALANGYIEELDHPVHGPYQTVTSPLKMDATPLRHRGPSPAMGQHTDEVLAELGFDETTVRALREADVVGRFDE